MGRRKSLAALACLSSPRNSSVAAASASALNSALFRTAKAERGRHCSGKTSFFLSEKGHRYHEQLRCIPSILLQIRHFSTHL